MNIPGVGGADPGNYRDRSPIRRREFDMPMRGRESDIGPPRGPRDSEMLMRPPHRDLDRGSRDFDGRDQRDWGRDQLDMMDPFAVDPYMERERDIRDPFISPHADHRANFGYYIIFIHSFVVIELTFSGCIVAAQHRNLQE